MINLKKRRNTRILIILISIFAIALIGFLITFYFTINSGNETQEQNNENEQTQGAIRNLQEETMRKANSIGSGTFAKTVNAIPMA